MIKLIALVVVVGMLVLIGIARVNVGFERVDAQRTGQVK